MAGIKKSEYQKLQAVKKRHCAGKATASDVTKAANKYIADTVAKGNKTKVEATKSANAVKNSGCSVSGVKKKRIVRKATTVRRKRA